MIYDIDEQKMTSRLTTALEAVQANLYFDIIVPGHNPFPDLIISSLKICSVEKVQQQLTINDRESLKTNIENLVTANNPNHQVVSSALDIMSITTQAVRQILPLHEADDYLELLEINLKADSAACFVKCIPNSNNYEQQTWRENVKLALSKLTSQIPKIETYLKNTTTNESDIGKLQNLAFPKVTDEKKLPHTQKWIPKFTINLAEVHDNVFMLIVADDYFTTQQNQSICFSLKNSIEYLLSIVNNEGTFNTAGKNIQDYITSCFNHAHNISPRIENQQDYNKKILNVFSIIKYTLNVRLNYEHSNDVKKGITDLLEKINVNNNDPFAVSRALKEVSKNEKIISDALQNPVPGNTAPSHPYEQPFTSVSQIVNQPVSKNTSEINIYDLKNNIILPILMSGHPDVYSKVTCNAIEECFNYINSFTSIEIENAGHDIRKHIEDGLNYAEQLAKKEQSQSLLEVSRIAENALKLLATYTNSVVVNNAALSIADKLTNAINDTCILQIFVDHWPEISVAMRQLPRDNDPMRTPFNVINKPQMPDLMRSTNLGFFGRVLGYVPPLFGPDRPQL